MPLLPFAEVAEHVSRAVVCLGVRYQFLHQVIAHGIVKVEVAPELVGVGAHQVVDGGKLLGYESLLQRGILFGGVPGDTQTVESLAFDTRLFVEAYLVVFVIIVELHQIPSRHQCAVAHIVVEFGYIHSVALYPNAFSKEIQASVVAVDYHLHRLLPRGPRQAYTAAQTEAGKVTEVAEVVVGVCQEGKMFAFAQTKQRLFGAEF